MPAGVTWTKYICVTSAALLSMFTGSQVVHYFYRPLDDLDDLVQMEVERRLVNRMKYKSQS